ncbi:hypothetical protein EVAR_36077_1 [Eumeta japonica]|uniref:Uncharacterized protein n=1 Tax=Eumeta variegata TaxID=151549 RepID=A0A4C1YJ97_EUMVA|nr:hypothetical protein EVAR_36077_1 [Eumeta japonica]
MMTLLESRLRYELQCISDKRCLCPKLRVVLHRVGATERNTCFVDISPVVEVAYAFQFVDSMRYSMRQFATFVEDVIAMFQKRLRFILSIAAIVKKRKCTFGGF